jgi:hypothetical protein
MRFHHGAIATASFFFGQHPASAAPTEKRGTLDPLFEITTLGGMTFKLHQVPNQKFYGARKGRGAMAIARAYSKYGAPVSDDLLSYIEQILEELGLVQKPGAGNDTSAGPQGKENGDGRD